MENINLNVISRALIWPNGTVNRIASIIRLIFHIVKGKGKWRPYIWVSQSECSNSYSNQSFDRGSQNNLNGIVLQGMDFTKGICGLLFALVFLKKDIALCVRCSKYDDVLKELAKHRAVSHNRAKDIEECEYI